MLNFGSMSLLRRDDLYVTIDIRATDISALEVARNLEIARSE